MGTLNNNNNLHLAVKSSQFYIVLWKNNLVKFNPYCFILHQLVHIQNTSNTMSSIILCCESSIYLNFLLIHLKTAQPALTMLYVIIYQSQQNIDNTFFHIPFIVFTKSWILYILLDTNRIHAVFFTSIASTYPR